MKSCLVVDDSAVVRKITRRILESIPMVVEEAEDGRQALDICRGTMPDSIFVDANMPILDGFDFVRELRLLANGDVPKVLLCATENDGASAVRAKHMGVDQFIMKPFDKSYLIGKFQEAGVI